MLKLKREIKNFTYSSPIFGLCGKRSKEIANFKIQKRKKEVGTSGGKELEE